MRRMMSGQAMIEYLLVSLLVVLGLFLNLAPTSDADLGKESSGYTSVANSFVLATHGNITAWHFGAGLAD